jgi:hypothetical protein
MTKQLIGGLSIAALVLIGPFSRSASGGPLKPNDPSVSGNLLAWYTDPADTYDAGTGVWADSGDLGNDLSVVPTYGMLSLSTDTPGSGLLAGEPVDVLTSTGSDLLGTPALNGGTGFSQATLIALGLYPGTSSSRPVGIGSYRVTGGTQTPHLNQAADGSIRRDDGAIAGSAAVPNRYFVRATVLSGDGATNAPMKDFYFDDPGSGFTATTNIDGSFDRVSTGNDLLYVGDVRQDDPGGSWVQVALYDTALSDQQVAGIAAWMSDNPNAGVQEADVILATDFVGRTVSGKTASNITWTTTGVQDPGDLTWVQEGGGPTGTGLFDTPDAQDHFAPDMNIDNEGPWSATITLAPTGLVSLDELIIDFQDFDNNGAFQSQSRDKDYTVTLTGSSSGLLDTVMQLNVGGISGTVGFEFTTGLVLTSGETYDLKILVAGSTTTGNNSGFDQLTLYGRSIVPEPSTLALGAFGLLALAFCGRRRKRR